MNFKSCILLFAALPGCALDMYGTGPIADRQEADPAVDAGPASDVTSKVDAGHLEACMATCLQGCCTAAGFCVAGSDDTACGARGPIECTDCTATGAHCDVTGVCDVQQTADACPPPFKVNPNDGGAHCTL